jgi:hypothetical protein
VARCGRGGGQGSGTPRPVPRIPRASLRVAVVGSLHDAGCALSGPCPPCAPVVVGRSNDTLARRAQCFVKQPPLLSCRFRPACPAPCPPPRLYMWLFTGITACSRSIGLRRIPMALLPRTTRCGGSRSLSGQPVPALVWVPAQRGAQCASSAARTEPRVDCCPASLFCVFKDGGSSFVAKAPGAGGVVVPATAALPRSGTVCCLVAHRLVRPNAGPFPPPHPPLSSCGYVLWGRLCP